MIVDVKTSWGSSSIFSNHFLLYLVTAFCITSQNSLSSENTELSCSSNNPKTWACKYPGSNILFGSIFFSFFFDFLVFDSELELFDGLSSVAFM